MLQTVSGIDRRRVSAFAAREVFGALASSRPSYTKFPLPLVLKCSAAAQYEL